MPIIRPCADLRNKYNEISKICHKTKEPIYITKNGTNDLVVLSDESYELLKKSNEERIDKLIEKKFDQQYDSFEDFKKDIVSKILLALKDVEDGKYQTLESFCAEMEEKYDIRK